MPPPVCLLPRGDAETTDPLHATVALWRGGPPGCPGGDHMVEGMQHEARERRKAGEQEDGQ